jgi:hypothetical protein
MRISLLTTAAMILVLGVSAANANEADIDVAHANHLNDYSDTYIPAQQGPAARSFNGAANDGQAAFRLQQNLDNQGGAIK